ncbi:hypothetical protein BH09MYX1_BH09MYX1_04070 [soil metagenome]
MGSVVGMVSACSSTPEALGRNEQPLESALTGDSPPTSEGTQDETAIAVINFETRRTVVATYNDGTAQPKLRLDATTRHVKAGASLAGWSTSDDDGGTWQYRGRVAPPPGWSVLWGDPAIVASRTNQNLVFISNLAVPTSKFPTSCPDGGTPCIDGAFTDSFGQSPYLGGACILRSTDSGRTFTSNASDCLHVSNHFYDGGSLVGDNDGNIYAAFVDVVDDAVDVWRLRNGDPTFVRLARPFNKFKMESHPRLRYDVGTDRIYVMAQADSVPVPGVPGDFTATVVLDWLEAGTWHGGVRVTQNSLLYPSISFSTNLADPFIRTGPQFSFDVGDASVNHDDDIRVAFTARRSDGRRYVGVSRCPRSPIDVTLTGSGKCVESAEWGTAYQPGQQWNPIVRSELGFIGVPPDWRLTFTSNTDETAQFAVNWRYCPLAVIGSGTRTCVQFLIGAHRPICPDRRGQLGDYDDMQVLSVSASGQSTFLRAHFDSQPTCGYRWKFTSDPLHLQSVTF